MSTESRALQVGDIAVTTYGAPWQNPLALTAVRINAVRLSTKSQSGILFQVSPPLRGNDYDAWFDADWFEPAPAKP
jgi:hypothetical protein